MRAVRLRQFGGPEVLVATDVPDPVAGPGQALIEVAFANLAFVETQFRASGAGPFKAELPMVLGNGVGGVVTSVGAGVDGGLVGKRVVSGTGGSGGYAELAAVDAGGLVEVPGGLALDSAVALLADIPDQAAATRGVTVVRGPLAPPGELRAFTDGRLRPVIGQRFPLERAADAHAAIQSRATVGKTLLEVR